MNFYGYVGTEPLGKENLGTDAKWLFKLKTANGAIQRMVRHVDTAFEKKPFMLYTYTNVYDNSTYTLVYRRDVA